MRNVNFDRVLDIIREVAAASIMPRFRNLKAHEISFKIGDDPVTIADKEAESALSARLLDLLPGSTVVGEENFASNPGILNLFLGESPVWIIDPIDGTRNFTAGSCEFGVIIALAERNQIVAGLIYDPTSEDVVLAEKGSGAWFQSRRLKTLPTTPLQQMYGFLGDRLLEAYRASRKPPNTSPHFDRMTAGSHEYPRLVINGSHFGKDKPQVHFRASMSYSTPWDDAAGVLIHHESGGYSAFWDGGPYQPSHMHRGFALAPDKDSWHDLKNWCGNFVTLPS